MILSKLGRSGKGKKSFALKSTDTFGYNIECSDGDGTVIFNNVLVFEWLYQGTQVNMTPSILPDKPHFDFSRYDRVTIRKACKMEDTDFVSRH